MPRKFITRDHPQMYEINTVAWLFELSQKLGKGLFLRDVPPAEWDKLKARGMDLVWLMGVWTRSEAGRTMNRLDAAACKYYETVLPGCKEEDIIGSCYAIGSGEPDPLVGDWDDIDKARAELNQRGMGLILDFIPNHRGIDHPWLSQHPEYFIQVSHDEYLRDKQAYFPVTVGDETLYIAHGKDPNFPSWTDTAQLNYFNPATHAAMLENLSEIARHCDGIRCDMAMLVLKEVFQKTWGWTNNSFQNKAPQNEFWEEAVHQVPQLIYIGEAYWDTGWNLQQLGFDFAYDKRLYDRLKNDNPHEVYLHLTAGMDYQKKLTRFIENHDELRSAAVFPKDKLKAIAVLVSGLPGMKLYFDGQFEGRQLRLPLQIRQTQPEEVDPEIQSFYAKLLPLVNAKICHEGVWQLKQYTSDVESNRQNVIVYLWKLENRRRLFIINLGAAPASGVIYLDDVEEVRDYSLVNMLDGKASLENAGFIKFTGLRFKITGFEARIFDFEI